MISLSLSVAGHRPAPGQKTMRRDQGRPLDLCLYAQILGWGAHGSKHAGGVRCFCMAISVHHTRDVDVDRMLTVCWIEHRESWYTGVSSCRPLIVSFSPSGDEHAVTCVIINNWRSDDTNSYRDKQQQHEQQQLQEQTTRTTIKATTTTTTATRATTAARTTTAKRITTAIAHHLQEQQQQQV